MKTTKLFLTLIFSLVLHNGYCDIISGDSHYVNKCVKITNISEYDNLVMLGYILHVGVSHDDTYEVSSSVCLTKGYKFNTLRLFGVNANYINGKNIDDIDLPNDSHALETNIKIDPYAGYYHDSNPINKIEEYYKIVGFTDTSVVIFKWKELFGFNNGSADSIKTYEYTEDTSLLYQTITTGIKENDKKALSIDVYPNPADKNITVEISNSYNGLVNMQLVSLSGKVVFSTEKSKVSDFLTIKFNTSNFEKGIYLLKIRFGEAIETKKIVIK